MARQQPIELFMPPNMLKAKLGGGSGTPGPDLAAIKRAETAMEALKGDFAEWAQDDVRRLVEARERYAKNPDPASRAALQRAAHDMKGQAATFDYPMIARVAGSLSKLVGELPQTRDLGRNLLSWVLGCAMVYAALFGVGKLCFGQVRVGTVLLGLAVACAVLLYCDISQRVGAGSLAEKLN